MLYVVRYYAGLLDGVGECLEKDRNVKQARAVFGFLCEGILRRAGQSIESLIDFYSRGEIKEGTEEYNTAYEEINEIVWLQKKIGHLEFVEKRKIETEFLLCKNYRERREKIASLPEANLEARVVIPEEARHKEEVEERKKGFFGKIRDVLKSFKQRRAEKKEIRKREKHLYKGAGYAWLKPIMRGGMAIVAGAMLYMSAPKEVKISERVKVEMAGVSEGKSFSVYETHEEEMAGRAFRIYTLKQRDKEMIKPARKFKEAVVSFGRGVGYVFDEAAGVG